MGPGELISENECEAVTRIKRGAPVVSGSVAIGIETTGRQKRHIFEARASIERVRVCVTGREKETVRRPLISTDLERVVIGRADRALNAAVSPNVTGILEQVREIDRRLIAVGCASWNCQTGLNACRRHGVKAI